MYNIYSYEYDLLKVVSTIKEAKWLTEFPSRLPGEHGFNRFEDPYAFEKREERLRHPIEVVLESNPGLPANHPELPSVVDWLVDNLILGDSDVLDVMYDEHRIISVNHLYQDGGQQGWDSYDFEAGVNIDVV